MGCVCGSQDQYHAEIERHLHIHDKADRVIKKLLLLGSGSSGKSTLFKQLKIIYDVGFEDSELEACRHTLRQNVVMGMLTLLRKSTELFESSPERYNKLRVDMENQELCAAIKLVVEFGSETFAGEQLPPSDRMKALGESIGTLWDLEAIQATFMRRGDLFSFPDNMDYFFNKAELLYLDDFQPNREDALKTRIRTTGLVQKQYEIKENYFHIFDVGGQRNERKKWIHSFENVTAVIYVAALSHFDAVCFEDESQNAMHESISLFNEICNSKWFRKTAMILFLNKSDLFREKLMECLNIDKCFNNQQQKGGINSINGNGWDGEEYHGPCYKESDKLNNSNINQDQQYFEHCYKSQVDFIAKLYYDQRQNEDKKIFTHITNATDRTNVEKVFWDCQNIVIRKNLSTGGFT